MKPLLCLLWLAAAPLAHAQRAAEPAPAATTSTAPVVAPSPDANTILVQLTDTPENAWRQLAQTLIRRGYVIEHSDKDLLTLLTYPQLLPTLGQPSRCSAAIIDGEIRLCMYSQVGDGQPVLMPRTRERRRGGNSAEWRELEAIAQQLGGQVRYAAVIKDGKME